jgi:MoxR-like ATPase
MPRLTPIQTSFVRAARKAHKAGPSETLTLTREQILTVATESGLKEPQWLTNHATYRVGRGQYSIPSLTEAQEATQSPSKAQPTPEATPKPQTAPEAIQEAALAFSMGSLIPEKMPTYVPFGAHKKISSIIKSGKFVGIYVTGLSGNGKTTTFEQVCAELGREFFRVNITSSTDEDDLMGGFRFINGQMVWVDGPVVVAMKRGGVLLLDEVDLGTHKIMCLQPVLEGKPVFLKKTCQWIYPKPGFTVALTGNTKGRGDETGKFLGTNPMNEAFLDRVALTIEQEYPKPEVEEKIVLKVMGQNGVEDPVFARLLVRWADQNRRAYAEGAIEDVITTRRLVQAATLYSVFNDRLEAVEGVLTRFDAVTRQSLLDLYKKLDAASEGGENTEPLGQAPTGPAKAASDNSVPF